MAPRYQNVALTNASPDKKWFLDEIGDGPVAMATFSKPFHELGGLFIDFKANRARPLTIRNNAGIQIISAADGTKKAHSDSGRRPRVERRVVARRLAHRLLRPHARRDAHLGGRSHDGRARQLTPKPVLATLVSSFDFSADGKKIAAVIIPDGRAAMPMAPAAPSGPQVKVADDADKNRLRTFPSLMSTPYDFQLLEWHATGQVVLIDVARARRAAREGQGAEDGARGRLKKIGQPEMVRVARPLARRQIRPRHAHDQALLVRRAGQQLRVGRRSVGPRRQGDGRARQAAAQRRRAGRHAAAAGPGAGPAARRRSSRAGANWRGAPTARG